MIIVEIKILRGPNYWSVYRDQLIQMKLDIEEAEAFPTNKIDGFAERIEQLIPSLYDHRCSEKCPGGFFQRIREGTWLGHVIEHVALEIQSLAGMQCGYGRTRSTGKKGVYHVVFAYEIEEAGVYAAKAAVRIVQALADNTPYDIAKDIDELKRIKQRDGLGPSTQALVNEAKKRYIPWRRVDDGSTIMLGHGINRRMICAGMADTTSSIAVDLAGDKVTTKKLLSAALIPVPKGMTISTTKGLEEAIEEIGFPLVIKPVAGNHGRGVTTNILTHEEALNAFEMAKKISRALLVEKFIAGNDYRLLVVNYKLVAAAKRIPAMIKGDGIHSIRELIQIVNQDPRRGEGHENILTTIKIDASTESILFQDNLTLDTVLPPDRILFLKETANLSTGGTARDVTHLVHPDNVFMAERIARLMGLNICGIDIIAEDINVPLTERNGAVLEVNAAPGLRMHLSPSKGMASNVAAPIIDMLYPNGKLSRIPLVAVTGTNGKTTTARLVAHFAKLAGHTVGLTTTDGIFIGDKTLQQGDCSGPVSAGIVLSDPLVDFAVLECARGGILRSGLGFDRSSVGIITNVSEDHLGLNDIDSLEELAKVKAVIANSVLEDGYAVLNADDDLVYRIGDDLDCKIALFSMHSDNERVKRHCKRGGIAAVIENGYFTLCHGNWGTRIAKIRDVPLTMEGRAECMINNILPAILAAVVSGIDTRIVQQALQSFIPSPDTTPGRMNIFKFRDFQFMVDYAHNTGGFRMLKNFLGQTHASLRVGIVGCPGDRRNEDIIEMGACAAEMFDEIIIRHDEDGRGRTNEEISSLLNEGIEKIKPGMPRTIISDEGEAIRYAIENAKEGSFIVVFSEKVKDSIAVARDMLEREPQFRIRQMEQNY